MSLLPPPHDLSSSLSWTQTDETPVTLSRMLSNIDSDCSSSYSSNSPSSGINWAQVYSSDEESQKSCSDLSLAGQSIASSASETETASPVSWTAPQHHSPQVPHRRPLARSTTSGHITIDPEVRNDNNGFDTDDSEAVSRSRSFSATGMLQVGSIVPWLVRCTPSKLLVGLFMATCYTTFCLPYPEIRPHVVVATDEPLFPLHHQTAAAAAPSPFVVGVQAVPSMGNLLHARAAPNVELEYRPGLDHYYEQEVFSNHAWTKYANVGALGTVIAWAVREQQRRREDAATTTISSSQQQQQRNHSSASASAAFLA